MEWFGVGEGADVQQQDGGVLVRPQGVQVAGEHPGGVPDQLGGVDAGGGRGVDPGDEDRPEPVGGDRLGDRRPEDVLQPGGPGGADPVRGPAPVAVSMVVTAPRCGARRHHNAAAGFSVGNGPCPMASVSSAGTGRPAVSARVSRPARTGQ